MRVLSFLKDLYDIMKKILSNLDYKSDDFIKKLFTKYIENIKITNINLLYKILKIIYVDDITDGVKLTEIRYENDEYFKWLSLYNEVKNLTNESDILPKYIYSIDILSNVRSYSINRLIFEASEICYNYTTDTIYNSTIDVGYMDYEKEIDITEYIDECDRIEYYENLMYNLFNEKSIELFYINNNTKLIKSDIYLNELYKHETFESFLMELINNLNNLILYLISLKNDIKYNYLLEYPTINTLSMYITKFKYLS